MNLPRLPGDLHATREALNTGRIRHPEVLEQAAAIAQSEACRHVFMPGRPPNPFSAATALSSTAFGDPGRVLAGMNVNVWDVTEQIQELVRAGYTGTAVDLDRLADPAVPLGDLL